MLIISYIKHSTAKPLTDRLTPDVHLRCSESDYFLTYIGVNEIYQESALREKRVLVTLVHSYVYAVFYTRSGAA